MTSYMIRPYQSADWQSICQIHDLARPDELTGSCDPRAFVPIEKDQEVEHLKLCQKLVSVLDNQIVGFVGIDEGYLGWLYIHPDHYGNGIGRKLLQEGLKFIPGMAWTIALAGNTKALNLYQSEGFVEVNRYQSDNAGYPCICLRLERDG
ncbi:MAG: GNAT family N-acetyltransferase [Chloroflexi bacterium]|nr:GNAT family N-acetyltransferase [Chloroflexota bacterium]